MEQSVLLVQVMAEGDLFNCYRGKPLVKKGGTLIITHPCTDKFDKEHHARKRASTRLTFSS